MATSEELKTVLAATVTQSLDEACDCRGPRPCQFCNANAVKILDAADAYAEAVADAYVAAIRGGA